MKKTLSRIGVVALLSLTLPTLTLARECPVDFSGTIIDAETRRPLKGAFVEVQVLSGEDEFYDWDCRIDADGRFVECELDEALSHSTSCEPHRFQKLGVVADFIWYAENHAVYSLSDLVVTESPTGLEIHIPRLEVTRFPLTVSCPNLPDDVLVGWSSKRQEFEDDVLPGAEIGTVNGGRLRSAVEQYFDSLRNGDIDAALRQCHKFPDPRLKTLRPYLTKLSESLLCFHVRYAADSGIQVGVWTLIVTPHMVEDTAVHEDAVFGMWIETEDGWKLDCGPDT